MDILVRPNHPLAADRRTLLAFGSGCNRQLRTGLQIPGSDLHLAAGPGMHPHRPVP
ncbi:hypothetical protein D3C87_2137500 [compost metagenome]